MGKWGLVTGVGLLLFACSAGIASSAQDHGVFMGLPVALLSVDGQIVQVPEGDTPAVLLNGRTMIPLRLVAELLGVTVDWDAEKRLASVQRPGVRSQPERSIQTAGLGEPLSADGVTVTLSSLVYTTDGPPRITFQIKNEADGPVQPFGQFMGVLTDPQFESQFSFGGGQRFEPDSEWVYPGVSREYSITWPKWWPGVRVLTVTYQCVLWAPDGPRDIVVGTWSIP